MVSEAGGFRLPPHENKMLLGRFKELYTKIYVKCVGVYRM